MVSFPLSHYRNGSAAQLIYHNYARGLKRKHDDRIIGDCISNHEYGLPLELPKCGYQIPVLAELLLTVHVTGIHQSIFVDPFSEKQWPNLNLSMLFLFKETSCRYVSILNFSFCC